MTINRRKLAAVAAAPIFVALVTVGDQWRLIEKLPMVPYRVDSPDAHSIVALASHLNSNMS